MLLMPTRAVRNPPAVGVKAITKLALPAAGILSDEMEVTVNSAALVPEIIGFARLSVLNPVLAITKVLLVAEPNEVRFKVEVLVAPLAIVFPLPDTDMVAVGAVAVVKPLATAPGRIQLEVGPVRANELSVPVFAPAASIKVTTAVFVPEGIP